MILGLFTQLLTAGGIERVGRHTAVVLAALARETGIPYRVLSLNDPSGRHEVRVGDMSAEIQGFARNKRRFVIAAVMASTRASVAYFGHVKLAMTGVVMKLIHPRMALWIHIHGVEVWEPLPMVARRALRMATGIVSISRFTADRAAEIQGFAAGKIEIVPNALDPEMIEQTANDRRPDCFPQGRKILLTVARLSASERYKGVDTVIRAMPAIALARPDVAYVIIGDGGDRPRLERLVHETGVDSHVHFVGHIPEPDLVSAYRHCDIFVMPSRGEGFGVVFLEAMTFEKPVIAGDHGGAPEVVEDGVTGYLVSHADAAATADRVIRLLKDEVLNRRMGLAGRKRVEDHFTFEHFRRRISRILSAQRSSSLHLAGELRAR